MHSSTVRENFSMVAWQRSSQGVRERAVRFLNRGIFFGLLALIAVAAVPYGAVQPQWESALECAVFFLTALWIVEGYLSGALKITGGPLLLPLVALIVLAFLQTFHWWDGGTIAGIRLGRAMSVDPYETRLVAFKLLAITLTMALLLHHTSSPGRLRALVYLVIGLGVASALFGLVRGTSQSGGSAFMLPFLKPGTGYAQFINPNHFAFLMEMSLGVVLGLVAGGAVRRERLLFHIGMVVAMWTALVFSKSRGGILSMMAQLAFVALLFTTVRSETKRVGGSWRGSPLGRWLKNSVLVRMALVICLVTTVALGVVLVGGESLVNRLEVVPNEIGVQVNGVNEGVRRIEIWRATWQLIKDYPLTGVGFGSYAVAIPRYHDASGAAAPREAHNDYLELLASGGVIAVMLGAWFVIVLIKQARIRLGSRDSFRRAACFGALAGLVGIAVHCLTDFGLHVTVNALVCVALIVIAVANVRVETDTLKHSSHP